MKPVTLAIVGAGSRGAGYATYAEAHPDMAQVTAVAEPREHYRDHIADTYSVAPERVFSDWRQLADQPRLADAALICTQDAMHVEPAVALAAKGYDLLLEKPMAPDEAGCRQIVEAAVEAGVIFAVCHVMRYTTYTQALKKMLDDGLIGEVVSLQHLEPVGSWHQAHSFVRGNWGNEAASSPMLLAKSCHDLDWLRYVMGESCESIQSFGTLVHFRAEERPATAGERCLECEYEPQCPYSAKRIYLGRVEKGHTGWPVNVLTPDTTTEGVTEALRTGPYGRCVYACDNDVVDNQVVNILFRGGKTASFCMEGLSQGGHRKTYLFGTRGQIYGDGRYLKRFDFLTEETETVDTEAGDASILGGHGGGDLGLMQSFVEAVAQRDQSRVLSGPKETLETHLMVFAAEKSRRQNSVVTM